MASKKEIREAFYAELETAAPDIVNYIGGSFANVLEQMPCIVHSAEYSAYQMKTPSAPTDTTENTDGDTTKLHYSTPMAATFTLNVLAESETDKEAVYDALRAHFEQYKYPILDVSTIHSDVNRVRIGEQVGSRSMNDREPKVVGDVLTVTVDYERITTTDVDSVQTVSRDIN